MKECSLHRITLCMYEIVYSAHGQTLISNKNQASKELFKKVIDLHSSTDSTLKILKSSNCEITILIRSK